eukprot:m.28541 g.28541  ORF g.28541 m.28541 type:complete len:318 (+) comp11854_c0_seq2:151-1104(+)
MDVEERVHSIAMPDDDQLIGLTREQHQQALSLIQQEFARLKQGHWEETSATIQSEIDKVSKGKHPVYLERREELLSSIKLRQDKIKNLFAKKRIALSAFHDGERELVSSTLQERLDCLPERLARQLQTDRHHAYIEYMREKYHDELSLIPAPPTEQVYRRRASLGSTTTRSGRRTTARFRMQSAKDEYNSLDEYLDGLDPAAAAAANPGSVPRQKPCHREEVLVVTAPVILYQLEEDEILDDLAIFNPIPQTRTSRKAATRGGGAIKGKGKRRGSPTNLTERQNRAKRMFGLLVQTEGIDEALEEMTLLHRLKKTSS